MAFSFNPTQPQGGAASPGVPQVSIQSPSGSAQDSPASIPDSPFLFLRDRGSEMTINAYLQLLLILVAVLSIAATIIIFVYSQYLSMSVSKKQADLREKESSFTAYPFEEMQSLSDRLIALDKILKGYVSSRSPLKFLEKVVENQVVFDEFEFSVSSKKGNTMSFTILAGSQRALIQQLDSLNLKEYSKVVPAPKMESFTDNGSIFRAGIVAPVFVQGVLADEVLFIAPPVNSGSTTRQQ